MAKVTIFDFFLLTELHKFREKYFFYLAPSTFKLYIFFKSSMAEVYFPQNLIINKVT